MSDLRKAAEMALEALEQTPTVNKLFDSESYEKQKDAIDALRQALAQPEPDDGYCQACDGNNCTAKDGCVARDNPPKREWVGLTDVDRSALLTHHDGWNEFGKAVEAKLKEKNT